MIVFWILAFVLIASAVWVVSAKKPVYSVVGLLLHFAALSVLYLSLSAEFLAIVQVVIYGGAILVLFVFVIALLSSGVAAFSVGPNRLPKLAIPAGLLALIGLGFLTYGIARVPHIIAPNASVSGSVLGVAGQANVFG
nr:NADH-quinone oxidoreductase subunit J [Candidatus Eremiobacteraeota bacterium]